MSLQTDLLDLEKRFWTGDAGFYRDNLDDECLTVFTEMQGVYASDKIADMVKEGPRWSDVDLDPKGLVQPSGDVAVLSYEARAEREGTAYHALVSSGYIKKNGAWKLMFHQQTPLE
jgi:hypothetical protein